MKALAFHFKLPRLAAAKILGQFSPRGYLSTLGPVAYQDIPDPKLLGDEWLILKTRYCGICGSDLKEIFLEGAVDNPLTSFISFPHVMGHEIVGTVEEVGKNVRRVKKGDRVIVNPWLGCEARGLPPCSACAAQQITFCENFSEGALGVGMHLGTARDVSGGFAPYLPAHESMCFVIPESVSFEQAALADPFSVSFHAVGKSPPRTGETALVYGCGPLGIAVIHILARLYPGVHIIAVDLQRSMEPVALKYGAHEFIAAAGKNLIEAVAEKTKSRVHRPFAGQPWLLGGVDRVYDTVGAGKTLETGLRLIKPKGTIVMVGVSSPARFEWTPLYFKEINIVGSNGCSVESFDGRSAHAFAWYLELCAAGKFETGSMVTHTFPLAKYRDAFMTAREKTQHNSLKVLFEP